MIPKHLTVRIIIVFQILFTVNVLKFEAESSNTKYAIFCMKKFASLSAFLRVFDYLDKVVWLGCGKGITRNWLHGS